MGAELFVGRAGELTVLGELVAALRGGTGGAVLVEGEQGIGKSALLRAGLTGSAGAGFKVGWGAADELGQRFPLRLLAECVGMAGRLAGLGSAEGPGGAAGPFEVTGLGGVASADRLVASGVGGWGAGLAGDPALAGVERLLALVDRICAVSPVVLVAEDLQWADEASLLVWRRLCQAVGQLPLLLAGSRRPGPGQEEGLAELRRALAAAGGRAVSLGPLVAGEVAELVGSMVGGRPGRELAGAVGQAGGNPLYVRELADGLVREGRVRVAGGVAELAGGPGGAGGAGVPVSLAAAIAERLALLPTDVVEVLRWAAVLGQEFSVADLEVVTGRSAGELMAAAVTARVVAAVTAEPATGRLGFRHGLIRQVLYAGMEGSLRVALHRQAAQALASAGAAAERVAAQLLAAQQAAGEQMACEVAEGWVREWLASAVPGLIWRAPRVTAELLRAALDPMAEADPRREALEAALVTAAFLLMRDEEVERAGRRVLARSANPELAAEAAWLVGYSQWRTGRTAEAAAVVTDALARPGLSEAQAARLRALQALILVTSGQVDRAAEVADEALAGARQTGDRFAAGYALHALCCVDILRRGHDCALAHLDRALGVIGDDPQTTDLRLLLLLGNKASLLGELDQHTEAIGTARQALVLAERAGTPRLGMIRVTLAFEHFQEGRWDEAIAELEPAADLPFSDDFRLMLHGLFALIAGHREDRGTAAEHLRAGADIRPAEADYWANTLQLFLARALAAEQASRPAEAVAVLAQCLDPTIGEQMPGRYELMPILARLALAANDATTAAAAVAAAEQEAEREPLPVKTAAAAHCRGLADADPAPVLAAADYYQTSGRPFDRAAALEDAALLAAARGDAVAARHAFATAISLYAGLGADWDIRRADARLRPYGIRRGHGTRQARPAVGWQALTPTEAKIAYLVAAGRSNPDIAAELLSSRNTVQTHVSHILAKLGARSRAEIVREALQHPPASEQATG